MYSNDSSYIITTIAPEDVQKKMLHIRSTLGIAPYSGGSNNDDIITKNLAHISLKGGFCLKEGFSEKELIEKIDTLSFTPLHLHSNDYAIYDTKELGKILVLVIEKNLTLQKLHMDIQSLLAKKTYHKDSDFLWEKENYTPHLSMIYQMKDEDEAEAIRMVKDILPLQVHITHFMLLGNNPGIRHTRKIRKEYYATN